MGDVQLTSLPDNYSYLILVFHWAIDREIKSMPIQAQLWETD